MLGEHCNLQQLSKQREVPLTLNATIASSLGMWCRLGFDGLLVSSRYVLLIRFLYRSLRGHGFCGTCDDLSISEKSLDKPVLLVVARGSLVCAANADVIVTSIAYATVPMCVGNGAIAFVAPDDEVGLNVDRRCLALGYILLLQFGHLLQTMISV